METGELIRALQADAARRRVVPINRIWLVAIIASVAAAALAFAVILSPREDFLSAMETVRFVAKFGYAGALTLTACIAVSMLSRPEASLRKALPLLLVAPALLLAAVLLELAVLPQAEWNARWIGQNARWCMETIPLIGLIPLAFMLLALRQGAPARPALAGAVAGLVAGGMGAFFYAAHCPDDSPLFVATWYTIAIAGLALAGSVGGRLFARW